MSHFRSLSLTLAACAAVAAPSSGQGSPRDVQIRSVDFHTGVLEVHNFGSAGRDLTGWRFCSHDTDEQRRYTSPSGLQGVTIAPGASVYVHFNDDAPAGATNRLNRSAVGNFATPLDGDAYGIQFFRPDQNGNVSFGDSSLIADHVQWADANGGAGLSQARTAQAVSQGLWTAAGEFARTADDSFRIELQDDGNGRLHGPNDYAAFTAELRVEEVLVDPIGPDAGNQLIELRNTSGAPFTPSGWWICVPFAYAPLPAIEVPEDGVVVLHIGAAGNDRPTDFYFPNLRPLNATDGCFVFESNRFGSADDIIDCVLWGGSTARADQAVQVGQWTAVGESVTLPTVEGETIAYAGRGVGPTYWYRDASPTVGQANEPIDPTGLGGGCATSVGTPGLRFLTPAVDGNRDYTIGIEGGTPGAVAGVQVGLPANFDLLGCGLRVQGLWFRSTTLDASGAGRVAEPLPTGLAGLGITLTMQAIVLDAASPNGIAGATPGASATIR